VRERIERAARDGRLARLPPILTFQSVLDFTVLTRAVVDGLYVHLPPNGSELVLFDLNRSAGLHSLLRAAPQSALAQLLPPAPRRFRTTLITNASPAGAEVVARTTEAGSAAEQDLPLGLSYPADVFSLSHIALPFPDSDGLYGRHPDPAEDFGVQLGAFASRGERGALLLSLDSLLRVSSNPFFPYILARIEQGMPALPFREAH
jgi:hypothetical protein